MSYLAFNASPYNESSNNTVVDDIEKKRQQRNTTIKKRPEINSKVKTMLNTINDNDNVEIHNEGGNMADFNPPPFSVSTTPNKNGPETYATPPWHEQTMPIQNNNPVNNNQQTTKYKDGPVGVEAFNNLPNTYSSDYTKQYVPYYNQMSQGTGNKDQLLEKLNYMIHLLEDQKDEKTGHIMEELILYSFLGVFMIFIVDSFARAGKYVR
jgi:hypothetical protein